MKIKVLPALVYCGKYLNTHHGILFHCIQHVYRATQKPSAERSLMKKQLSRAVSLLSIRLAKLWMNRNSSMYVVRTNGHTQSKTLEPLQEFCFQLSSHRFFTIFQGQSVSYLDDRRRDMKPYKMEFVPIKSEPKRRRTLLQKHVLRGFL